MPTNANTPRYDPFLRGPFPAGVKTIHAADSVRSLVFPCEIWYPAAEQHAGHDLDGGHQDMFRARPGDRPHAQKAVRDAQARPGRFPLILFSHSSGSHRRQSTFLCTHLCSHGYVVAAMNHSEVVAPELSRREGETSDEKRARAEAWIANRVPDVQFLLAHLLSTSQDWDLELDAGRVGIAGHSFGGWTALAAPDVEPRFGAVVALAPGGSSQPRPGILPLTLSFDWRRDVPVLYLVAENDVSLPLAGMFEIFDRTPATKQMLILRRADHLHFLDDVAEVHEAVRAMQFTAELAWLPKEMLPASELCSGEQAHMFVSGLTLAHMDAVLQQREDARRFLSGNVTAELESRGIIAIQHKW